MSDIDAAAAAKILEADQAKRLEGMKAELAQLQLKWKCEVVPQLIITGDEFQTRILIKVTE